MLLDQAKSQLKAVNEFGEETVVELAIDTFALSIFGLLMCTGSLSEKSERLH